MVRWPTSSSFYRSYLWHASEVNACYLSFYGWCVLSSLCRGRPFLRRKFHRFGGLSSSAVSFAIGFRNGKKTTNHMTYILQLGFSFRFYRMRKGRLFLLQCDLWGSSSYNSVGPTLRRSPICPFYFTSSNTWSS